MLVKKEATESDNDSSKSDNLEFVGGFYRRKIKTSLPPTAMVHVPRSTRARLPLGFVPPDLPNEVIDSPPKDELEPIVCMDVVDKPSNKRKVSKVAKRATDFKKQKRSRK